MVISTRVTNQSAAVVIVWSGSFIKKWHKVRLCSSSFYLCCFSGLWVQRLQVGCKISRQDSSKNGDFQIRPPSWQPARWECGVSTFFFPSYSHHSLPPHPPLPHPLTITLAVPNPPSSPLTLTPPITPLSCLLPPLFPLPHPASPPDPPLTHSPPTCQVYLHNHNGLIAGAAPTLMAGQQLEARDPSVGSDQSTERFTSSEGKRSLKLLNPHQYKAESLVSFPSQMYRYYL